MVSRQNIENVYHHRVTVLEEQLKELNTRHVILGLFKLGWVIIGALAVLKAFPLTSEISLGIFGFCIAALIVTAIIHENIIRRLKHRKKLKIINENELALQTLEFPAGLDSGDAYLDPAHQYSSDMNVFGVRGIFHYINRGVTAPGRNTLAEYLKNQALPDETIIRQEAVKELSAAIDLRQTTAAYGLDIDDSPKKTASLFQFLEEPFLVFNKKILLAFISIWPVLTLFSIVLIAFNVPWTVFFGMAIVQVVVNKKYFFEANRLYKLTTKSAKILKAYAKIIAEIEKTDFTSSRLRDLQERLSVAEDPRESQPASQRIGRLSVLLEWFDARNGMLHGIFNNILFWDLHCLYRIEKWRNHHAKYVPGWFEAAGEYEALSSLAAMHFNHPEWTFPEITSGPFHLEASQAGHPLIVKNERVDNDILLEAAGAGSMMIVTGPNMAGKSTFLRTVGVNIILAFAGGPVCAKSFKISSLSLFTSMQTSDSLDQHISLFYAELKRLKMILDGMDGERPVFFLIDEMLKGTNALDRQKGAIALLKQLIHNHANGIVATHDLELTKLDAVNYHFDGYVKDDKLLFDYLLKKGPCQSFNALALMRTMGIDV